MASVLQVTLRLAIVLLMTVANASSADTQSPLTAEQMREDLVFLRDVWAPMDKSFAPADRARFETAVNATIARVGQLTPAEFSLEIARAVAMAGNGHTNAELGGYFQPLPFRAVWFDDGLFIVRAHPSYAWLLGARIDKFGALSAEEARRRVRDFISGSDEHARILSANYLRLREVLQYIGAAPAGEEVTLRLTLPDGHSKSVKLGAEPSPDPELLPSQHQLIRRKSPEAVDNRWPHVLDRLHSVPSAYSQFTDVATEWLPGEPPVFYLRSDIIDTAAGSTLPFQVKLAQAFEEVASKKPRFVVVDLRYNHGGLLLYTVVVANGLPRILPADGKLFVLVGPGTFSAAIAMAAMLKGSGRDKVVLVGETMGDHPQFWAEGLPVQLPNSRISVQPAMGYHDWANGCDGNPDCFWGNAAFARKSVSLQPQIEVPMRFKEYAAGRDVVLEAALAAIGKELQSTSSAVTATR